MCTTTMVLHIYHFSLFAPHLAIPAACELFHRVFLGQKIKSRFNPMQRNQYLFVLSPLTLVALVYQRTIHHMSADHVPLN